MISKILKTLVLGTLILTTLTGCIPDRSKAYERAEKYLMPKEKMLLDEYYEDYAYWGYDKTLTAIAMSRYFPSKKEKQDEEKGIKTGRTLTNGEPPFCDVIGTLEKEEAGGSRNSSLERGSILTMYEDSMGKTLRQHCTEHFDWGQPKNKEVQNNPEDKKDVTYLSIADYKVLEKHVEGCVTAEHRLVDLISEKDLLTLDDMKNVEKLVLKCAARQLVNKLNEK